MKNARFLTCTAAMTAAFIAPANATTAYNESTDGDLAGDLTNPTAITLTLGPNTVAGSFGSNDNAGATDGSDADYLTFTLAPGQSIDAITLDEYTTDENPADLAFIGYAAGNAFTGQAGEDVDAFELFSAFTPTLLAAAAPLGPGDHAFWLQQTSTGIWNYQITFNVVPEPASLGLLALGAGLAASRRRRLHV